MSRGASKAFLKALEQARCDHRFNDGETRCRYCDITRRKLKLIANREAERVAKNAARVRS